VHLFTAICFVVEACMDLNVLEGFVEVEGRYPILITALHGFGADSYRDLVKAVRACVRVLGFVKTLGAYEELNRLLKYSSAVDLFTWETAFKVAVAEELWALLPTLSKVDKLSTLSTPDCNLNKGYAISTPFWRRARELVESKKVRVVIDIHGMKDVKKWPDVCISTRGLTTASKELIDVVTAVFKAHGLRVAVDHPFVGGAFIAHFGRPLATEAFAIEVKRSLRFCGSAIPSVVRDAIRAVKEYLKSWNSQ
jgi:hypothetical protein